MGKFFKAVQNKIQSSEQTERISKQSKIKYNRQNKRTVAAVSSEDKRRALNAMEELRARGATTDDLMCRWLRITFTHLMLETIQFVQFALLYLVSWYYKRHKKMLAFLRQMFWHATIAYKFFECYVISNVFKSKSKPAFSLRLCDPARPFTAYSTLLTHYR